MSLFLAPDASVFVSLLDVVFTGVVVGGGSQPIHAIIRFISERKVIATPSDPAASASSRPSTLISAGKPLRRAILANALVEPPAEVERRYSPINYRGGINIEALTSKHIRKKLIDLVVYHHTAASSNASFEHIVNELVVKKGWLTGYHCVVMPNGDLNFMCRWDRYGSHAKGKNLSSLGIAFQGNFHSAPGDRFSNADGRFGNQIPTQAQLHSGARLIALWVHLYRGLSLDFTRSIIPHRDAMPGHTVCPGSNFPHQELAKKIDEQHRFWLTNADAKLQLEVFKSTTPFVYSEAETR